MTTTQAVTVPEQVGPVASSFAGPPPDGFVYGARFLEAGLSYRRVDYWTRIGYLKAAQTSVGSGFKRLWPEDELAVAVAIMRLVDVAGIDLGRAVMIARGHRPAADQSYIAKELAPGIRLVLTPELWRP